MLDRNINMALLTEGGAPRNGSINMSLLTEGGSPRNGSTNMAS
jgi:hypothetical protein